MKQLQRMGPREMRIKLGINQKEFWERLGVTQSGGSRFENGRNMSVPVQMLYRLVYVEKFNIGKVRREDMDVMAYLRAECPAEFKTYKKQAGQWLKTVQSETRQACP